MKTSQVIAVAVLLGIGRPYVVEGAPPLKGHHPAVDVEAPTRLDWVFALANQSPADSPADWTKGYDSTAQRYELYVPASVDPRKPTPLVLFISPSSKPTGLTNWRTVCDQFGVVFASPHNAGNDANARDRTHIVLDVLDDMRRRFVVDPDRTYLGGFSGGARVACHIAFALPEYFGGVVPVCGAENLRSESWLRRRVADRLSVALITGETDFNRAELERFRGPLLKEVGVRAEVRTVPKLGHGVPSGIELSTAFRWLEEGLADRKKRATEWPAMHLTEPPPTRAAWSNALLEEAKKRIAKPATLYTGLMQLQGLATRWNDLPAADEANRILAEYDAKAERPWEADDVAEQRLFFLAEARALGSYATGELPKQYEGQRAAMAAGALQRWQQVLADDPDSPEGKEAAACIAELSKIAGASK